MNSSTSTRLFGASGSYVEASGRPVVRSGVTRFVNQSIADRKNNAASEYMITANSSDVSSTD